MFAPRGPEAGRQIGNWAPGQVAGKPVEHGVSDAPRAARLRIRSARADHEIVVAEAAHKTASVLRSVLTIGIDDEDILAGCSADAGFDRGAVSLVVWMPDHLRAGGARELSCPIARPIVNDEDFTPLSRCAQP